MAIRLQNSNFLFLADSAILQSKLMLFHSTIINLSGAGLAALTVGWLIANIVRPPLHARNLGFAVVFAVSISALSWLESVAGVIAVSLGLAVGILVNISLKILLERRTK